MKKHIKRYNKNIEKYLRELFVGFSINTDTHIPTSQILELAPDWGDGCGEGIIRPFSGFSNDGLSGDGSGVGSGFCCIVGYGYGAGYTNEGTEDGEGGVIEYEVKVL